MRAAGIICEYNPFHLGHEKQLRLVRERVGEDTAAVCLMSGNFVQRGAPAVFDKTVRARAALPVAFPLPKLPTISRTSCRSPRLRI